MFTCFGQTVPLFTSILELWIQIIACFQSQERDEHRNDYIFIKLLLFVANNGTKT